MTQEPIVTRWKWIYWHIKFCASIELKLWYILYEARMLSFVYVVHTKTSSRRVTEPISAASRSANIIYLLQWYCRNFVLCIKLTAHNANCQQMSDGAFWQRKVRWEILVPIVIVMLHIYIYLYLYQINAVSNVHAVHIAFFSLCL